MDEVLWRIKWSAALTPELAMIPDRSVFLRSSMGRSLTATVEGMTGTIWETWEDADGADGADGADNVSNAGNVTDRCDVEVVEGICCCTTQEPSLETRVSQGQVLFV